MQKINFKSGYLRHVKSRIQSLVAELMNNKQWLIFVEKLIKKLDKKSRISWNTCRRCEYIFGRRCLHGSSRSDGAGDATGRSGRSAHSIETRAEWQLVDIVNVSKQLNQLLYTDVVTPTVGNRTPDRRVEFSRLWTRILYA